MKINLEEKGITLVALVVTVIILLILAGVTIGQIVGNNGLFKRAREAVEKYQDEQGKEKNGLEKLDAFFGNSVKNEEIYEKVKVNKPKLADGMIPIKYDETKQNWVITNESDEDWYDYSEGKMLWANVMLSDGKYKESNKDYTEDGTTEVKEEELGSMFVWVPRYAYSFNSYHTEMDRQEGTTQKITNIVFLNGTGNKDFENNSYERKYNVDEMLKKVGEPTPMIVHPGFTFGEEELTGIWVAKFEATMSGEKTNTIEQNNIETKNTATEKCIKIVPNEETWRCIDIGNSFLNCLNMNGENNIYGIKSSQIDTHLIKNIEWGIVAYISSSQYGYIPTCNVNYTEKNGEIIGLSAEGDYRKNINQSTTGNITGIYDMNGGGQDWVAAYYDNLDSSLNVYGKSIFDENRQLNEKYKKYWDKYEGSKTEKNNITLVDEIWRNWEIVNKLAEGNEARKKVADERYNLMKDKLGDAMYETIGNQYTYFGITTITGEGIEKGTYYWMTKKTGGDEKGEGYYNDDAALIGNCFSTFIFRGGIWYNGGNGSGIFSLCDDPGTASYDRSFRPSIVLI